MVPRLSFNTYKPSIILGKQCRHRLNATEQFWFWDYKNYKIFEEIVLAVILEGPDGGSGIHYS